MGNASDFFRKFQPLFESKQIEEKRAFGRVSPSEKDDKFVGLEPGAGPHRRKSKEKQPNVEKMKDAGIVNAYTSHRSVNKIDESVEETAERFAREYAAMVIEEAAIPKIEKLKTEVERLEKMCNNAERAGRPSYQIIQQLKIAKKELSSARKLTFYQENRTQ